MSDETLVIPPPRPDRPPMHANLLNVMQKGNTSLTPLFPYMHAGAIVATGVLFTGGPDRDYGQFFHHNSVDEIIIAFVARGATLETGQLYNGGRVHGVNSFLKDQSKPDSFALFSVVQRQVEEGPQVEGISMNCTGCRKELYREDWDSETPPDAHELEHPFKINTRGAELMRRFNADPALRTCKSCGLVNEPFPLAIWGWDLYDRQSRAALEAKHMLDAAGNKSGAA